jgi:hypothetical protein
LWFEKGSPFLARLSTELGDIPYKVVPLLWSGANSIFVRDKIARVLADHLVAEHAEHPQATQLIIAHSHGGNIALRALHHLQQRDASQLGEADGANPLVVTLATPFIEVHQADFGRRPFFIRLALVLFIFVPLLNLLTWLPLFLGFALERFFPELLAAAVEISKRWVPPAILLFGDFAYPVVLVGLFAWWWILGRAPARQNKLDALKNATRLGKLASAQRLLVIRAIDDEASLTLALGAILNYLTERFILYMLFLYFVFVLTLIPVVRVQLVHWFSMEAIFFVGQGCVTLTIMLLGILMLSRSVHGRELVRSPMECQINTQSAPDAKGLSEIITLVRHTFVKSLRHGIYDHEDCAKTISDWVRSQLSTAGEIGR